MAYGLKNISIITFCFCALFLTGAAATFAQEGGNPDETQETDKKTGTEEQSDEQAQGATQEKETAEAFEPFKAIVTPGILNIRAKRGTHFEILGRFHEGDQVQVKEVKQGWYKVPVPADARAWVAQRLINDDGVVQGDNVRVRAGAGLAFTPYFRLHKGQKVEVLDKSFHGWQKIKPPEQATAWISAEYAKRVKTKTKETKSTGTEVAEKEKTAEDEQTGETAEKKTVKATAEAKDTEGEGTSGQPDKTEVAERKKSEAKEKTEKDKGQTASRKERGKEPRKKEKDTEAVKTEKAGKPEKEREKPGKLGLGIYTKARPAPGTSRRVDREGVIVDLGKKRTPKTTHVLAREIEGVTYPIAYLSAELLDLNRWEMTHVRVYGSEKWLKHWKRPLISVHGVVVVEQESGR